MTKLSKPFYRDQDSDSLYEYTVSELTGDLKKAIETSFRKVCLRGEVSDSSQPASGHLYFTLKDANATISAICWRGVLPKLKVRPEEGAEIIVTGYLTIYPPHSRYQIIIDSAELAGEGALLKLLEDRRKKLLKEGLFEEAIKQPLPYLPEVIGLVTSPTGSVIKDILHRLRDRFPRRVLLWPVPVQGDEAAPAIEIALKGFNGLSKSDVIPRPDVIIVARGGGSVEDLWPFNEEILVRAAFESTIPIVSAVGHETDTTLLDYAADLRAPTPTAAAELTVPVRANLLADTSALANRIPVAMNRVIEQGREKVIGLARGLRGPREELEKKYQSLDYAIDRLSSENLRALSKWEQSLNLSLGKLNHKLLVSLLSLGEQKTRDNENRLMRGIKRVFLERDLGLNNLAKLLDSVSHKRVLARGYAMLRDIDNATLTSVSTITKGMKINIELKDGRVSATANKAIISIPSSRTGKFDKD